MQRCNDNCSCGDRCQELIGDLEEVSDLLAAELEMAKHPISTDMRRAVALMTEVQQFLIDLRLE